jgi:lipoprotein-anchoring transpeptidase ErfK/SrfK
MLQLRITNLPHSAAVAAAAGPLASLVVIVVVALLVPAMATAQDPAATFNAQQSPAAVPGPADPAVHRAALAFRGMKIMVSTNERRLLLVTSRDTLLDVAVAVGMGSGFEFEGRRYHFETPTGRRRVLAKEQDPVWTPPDWHYKERALELGLDLVRLNDDDQAELEDGSFIIVRDGQVGRVNEFGNFWAFTPGTEIIFDGRIFMPPFGTAQRRIPDALGPYKLDLGNGYLIHGTHMFNEESVGLPVSHGCVRMNNADLDRLYYMVETGTPVFIY